MVLAISIAALSMACGGRSAVEVAARNSASWRATVIARSSLPGATVVGGMVFVGSGYVGTSNGMPGNVLLAFGTD